ncbi:MAG: hypothetical protein OEV08_14520 [Nitrospira sp.]|nr:hypothetical protein [Nitrospira sp.]
MRCIIHIGMHKTGSTSIQQSLHGFSDDRFLYAHLGVSPNHSLAIYSLFSESPERHHLHKANGRDGSAVQNYVEKMRIDLEQSISTAQGRTVLISGEDISLLQQKGLDKLCRYFRGHFDELLICGYVRPPAGFITSGFQERVKGGQSDRVSPDQAYRHYEKTFGKFDEIFGRENVQLWKFEPKSFPNGCVVQDFCARLDIAFPVERIIRANESISRQAVSLLYTYRKFGEKLGFRPMGGGESQRLVAALGDIRHDKFRFSPAIVRPVLDANRTDIQWMEERLGQSLHEELGAYRPGDVRDETDLLWPDPEVVKKLLALLGDAAPAGIKGEMPEEVAVLVHALRKTNPIHALREVRISQVGTLIEQIRKTNPKLLEGIPGDKAEALIRKVFTQMNHALAMTEEGVVKFVGLGQFRARKVEKELEGKKVTRTQIVFTRSEQ